MILYISKCFEDNIGANMHYKALQEIWGNDHVYTVDLRLGEPVKRKNYVAYGKYKNVAERVKRMLQGNMDYISNLIIEDIIQIIGENKIEIVFVEDSVFGNLVRAIKKKHVETRVITFYHDIKADLYRAWIKKEKWIYRPNLYIGIHQEKINQKYSDCNIVFNQRDAELYKKTYGCFPDEMIALPAPIPPLNKDCRNKVSKKYERKTILFVGKNYYPNIIGIEWFYENVLPKLCDNILLQIVGRGLEFLKNEFSDTRVEVIGEVESLESYYQNADIVIAPLFDGGGMKSKTVEAISYGKTFVGTEESLFGFWEEMPIQVKNKMIYQSNQEEEWINVLNKLVDMDIPKFNPSVYKLFEEKFSYDISKEKLRVILGKRGK